MRWLYKSLLRRLLFCLKPKHAHELALLGLDWTGKCWLSTIMKWFLRINDSRIAVEIQGIQFPNPVLMPAGFSKDGRAIAGIAALGYGGGEIGSFTKDAWGGNTEPCLIRIVEYGCLANRMGFNNPGSEKASKIEDFSEVDVPFGLSFTLSPDPAVVDPVSDLIDAITIAAGTGAFCVIDIGCPNVYNGRFFLDEVCLADFLSRINVLRRELNLPPFWVKLPPNLSEEKQASVISVCLEHGIQVVVLGNTADDHVSCGLPRTLSDRIMSKLGGKCGLSGKLLFPQTLRNVRSAYRVSGGKMTIVACGGISSGQDAWQCICAGASIVQVLTGLIFEGPTLVRDINRYLLQKVEEHGLGSITEAIGREDLAN